MTMSVDTRSKAVAAAWLIVVFSIAFLAQVGSRGGWLVASLVAFVPALTLLYFYREPARTTSQRIHDARR